MGQKELTVYNFKKGDIITRIKPSKPITILGEETYEDRSYIGTKLIFIGIANGSIYFEKESKKIDFDSNIPELDELFKNLKSGPIHLPLDVWDEGWSYYIDPYKIEDNRTIKSIMGLDKDTKSLKEDLKKALESEDYEKADKIKKEINRRK